VILAKVVVATHYRNISSQGSFSFRGLQI